MSQIELTIDGQQVFAKPGQTILEVAKQKGIHIPTLCYHPRLSISGACRVCVVEIEGAPNLAAACAMPVSKGMVVKTSSERVLKARRMVVELLLANHKLDCVTCESNGKCELQDIAYELGIERDKIRFPLIEPKKPVDDSSSLIVRDHNKCILCGRCVRACQEVRQEWVIGFGKRGFNLTISAGIDQSLSDSDCTSCGECVQVCPTGALTEKPSRFKGQWWKLRKVTTVCPYCGVGCLVDLYVRDQTIVRVMGNEDGPENMGSLCIKGRFGYDFVQSKQRLTSPMIKKDGVFQKVSWSEALEYVASRFKEIKEKYGADSLAGLSSAKCTNEENYLFQKFIRICFGTNNIDHCARLCHAPTVVGLSRAFGSGAMTNSIREVINSDAILVIGSNTTENHPIIGMYIKQAVMNNGAKLIVADPRKVELVKFSKVWLRHKNGTDVALLNGIMNVILNEGLYDKEFVDTRCEGFEEFAATVSKYTPEAVEEITGVSAERIREAARIYAKSKRGSIFFSMGVTQHTTGVDNVLSVANLAMLTGNVGKESAGVNPLRGQNNVQGACDMGALPNFFTGYQQVTDEAARERLEKAWGTKLSGKAGLTVVEMMNAAYEGRLKGLYIMGENPMVSDPNLNHVKEALERLEFLVVQDIFMTETAQLADVVL
ncbi:MAG: molybdopterin-dependent oxidoreductase, partial [Nitrososphaerota archaeon]